MGVVCETTCFGKQIDKKELILEVTIRQPGHNQSNDPQKGLEAALNPTIDSKCNTIGCKSTLKQEEGDKVEEVKKPGYPSISFEKHLIFDVPPLDPTITINKDHPFFYRNYGTEIKKPAVRNTLKARSGIEKDEQLSRTFNQNNDQKGQARNLTKSSI